MTKYFATIIGSLVMLSIWSFTSITFSDEKTQQLIAKTNLFNLRFPQEKIYLHLDRHSYWANDDLWFKAYVKHSPIDECNLYVEIINSSGSVIYKNIAWVQNGLAYGDIHLADTLSSGIYQIRAYTNWMRNFDETWFFRKDLVIWNPVDKKIQTESEDLKAKNIDLQFFPEGGTFVSGVKNKVAFKATDNHGKGIDFEGIIFDDSRNQIVDIKSDYKGIGSFAFEPQEGTRYSAEVRFSGGVVKSANLPKQKSEGIILAVNAFDSSKIEIQLIEKSLDLNKAQDPEYFIVGQSGGEICYHKKIAANEEISTIEIEKHTLPGGIIKFSLFDSNLIPVCERLVFNNHVDFVNLVIKTEKSDYLPREKVKIGVAAFTDERQPCVTNLSMSVYNTFAQLKEEEYPNNIFTQFLLNAELKGNIENPAYYFKDDSLATMLALDNLMLTHGYREFEWKEILEDEFPEITHQPEPSIELKGRVISDNFNKPVVKGKVTMMTLKSLLDVQEAQTDSLGQFAFSNFYFYDTISVSLQAVNKRGNKSTSIGIDTSSSTSPKSMYLPYSYEYNKEQSIQTLTYLSETKSNLIKKKWSLSDTILIGDVNVVAKKIEEDDGLFRRYLKADFVLDLKKHDGPQGNIFESIEGRIPGVVMEKDGFYARGERLKIYMDGMEDLMGIVETLPSQMFDKVEYVKSGIFAGVNYKGGILFFYAKRGKKNEIPTFTAPGMESAQIIGYSVSRKFYSPKYDSTEPSEKKEDYRNTIYWNPVVQTDSTGVALLEFYNSDEIGDMKIVVEGITADGKLCRGIGRYSVRNY
jgi:hypothetical protein